MNATHRYYHSDDLMRLHHLLVELGYTVPPDELGRNVTEILSRGGAVFVAEVNNEVVGAVCSILDARLAEGLYAEIVSLVVSSRHRGEGIGRQLVAKAEAWSRQYTRTIRVRANVQREHAHAFYKALCFEEIKEQKVFKKSL